MHIIAQYARGLIDETTFTNNIKAMSDTELKQLLRDSMATTITDSMMGEKKDDNRRLLELKALKIIVEVVKSSAEKS